MKKIYLFIIAVMASASIIAQPTITKTADKSSAYIGDNITYTIQVCGVTNASQMASITDNLGDNLAYIGTDLLSTPLASTYTSFCSGTLPSVSVSAGNILSINFPSCSFSMSSPSCFSFKIFTKVKDTACYSEGKNISNTIKLNPTTSATWATQTSSPSMVAINTGVPWTLIKNYRSYASNLLKYDVRLNAAYGGYSSQVLFNDFTGNPMFTDTLFLENCMDADPLASTVYWTKDDGSGGTLGVASGLSILYDVAGHFLILKWNLPPVSATGGMTLNSYLFTIEIKTINCTCTSPIPFDIKNKVYFNAVDKCNKPVKLKSTATVTSLTCKVPSCDTACISKKVEFVGNSLGLAMAGCKGKYTITIKNCSDYLNYTNIKFTDNAPLGISFGIPTCTGAPSSSLLGSTSTSVVFNSSTIVPFTTGVVVVTIPFVVNTFAPPNSEIKNCVAIKINAYNTLTSSSFVFIKTVCAKFKTIPTEVTAFLEKKLCTSTTHSCGPYTSNSFIPNDTLSYMLHFYNFGTATGTNLVLTDVLPAHFTVVNPLTDIKVYTAVASTWGVNNNCNPSGISPLTGVAPVFNATTREIKVNFGAANPLKPFTCSGITHYFVKVKVKIQSTAPNGLFNNVFRIDYDTLKNLPPHTPAHAINLSNVVSVNVNLDNLVISKKTIVGHSQNCDKQTDTVHYEIMLANMGQLPIMYNLKDRINLPSGVTTVGSVFNVKHCKFSYPTTSCVVTSPFSSGLTITGSSFTLINQWLNPCEVIKIRYSVVFNTAGLPTGASVGKDVCNQAIIEAGFPKKIWETLDYTNPLAISLSHNSTLITQFFEAKTDGEKNDVLANISKENGIDRKEAKKSLSSKVEIIKMYPLDLILSPLYTFTPITRDTINPPACYYLTSCMNGIQNGCFNTSNTSGVTFKINSIDLTGKVSTTLTLPSTPKITKVEYILTDIRMVRTCPLSPPWKVSICSPCNESLFVPLFGSFHAFYANPWGNLGIMPIATYPLATPFGTYNELNKTIFSSPTPLSMGGTYPKDFQLPINTLNCGGRLEFVITVMITYEDCSVCYISDAFKYNAIKQWSFPNTNDYTLQNIKK